MADPPTKDGKGTAATEPVSTQHYNQIYAAFAPQCNSTRVGQTRALLPKTSPLVASALNGSFPLLLLIDHFLSFATWTNKDPYYNFLCISVFITIVKYWGLVSFYGLPLLLAIIFSSTAWFTQMIYRDSKEPPTLEEIVDTLSNINTKFDALLEPLTRMKKLNSRQLFKLFIGVFALSPMYIFAMTSILSTKQAILSLGVLLLSYHSSWNIATRRLLWRSLYIRKLIAVTTGLPVGLHAQLSATQLARGLSSAEHTSDMSLQEKIVTFQVFENQRRWLGVDWSCYLLPFERSAFTNEFLEECHGLTQFEFPPIPTTSSRPDGKVLIMKWSWADPDWSLDLNFNDNKSPEGWVFYNNNWKSPSYSDSITSFTRTRKWLRKAKLIVQGSI
ncbi:BA75_02999T0 [Komagataella pastoris]|uniref:BA75_02999T0 n=1 Tax=Komagataella pastoris TaxID=4922 RepID=A0A1B2JCJ2_PICPA|nr:BA75_02999T0 [Komagataella pastoris]